MLTLKHLQKKLRCCNRCFFISLKLVLPVVKAIVEENSDIIALVKPQFEAGKEKVGRKGVIRNPKVHKEVLTDFIELGRQLELALKGVTHSPITGPEGNIEFLAYLHKSGRPEPPCITIRKSGCSRTGSQ